MPVNYRGIIEVLMIAVIFSVGIWVLSPPVNALPEINTSNGSVVIVENPTVNMITHPVLDYIPRIEQGDTVYLNDTVDITGVTGWPDAGGNYRLMYYGPWVDYPSPGDLEPEYVLKLPGRYRSGQTESQYRFYIDPVVFSGRPGTWYQWQSNITRMFGGEAAGNLRAFKVVDSYRQVFNATSNETEGFYQPGNYTEKVIKPEPLMPERHVADYVVAKGDNITWPLGGEYHTWMFGRLDHIYGYAGNVISADRVKGMEAGTYTFVMHSPGPNTIYEALYDGGDKILPGLYGQTPSDIAGLQPDNVYAVLRDMVSGTDDTLRAFTVDLQDPYITLDRADEKFILNKSVLDVRGYSNVAPGTEIAVMLDESKSYYKFINLRTVTTTAVRTSPGNLSYYQVYVPIDYENLAANAMNHTLTARTALGGSVQKDFKISIMPADSYRPNATLKYIEDRNPFVPTPTPIVNTVTVERTVKVVETVVVVETPDTSDYGKVVEGGAWWVSQWIGIVIIVIVVVFVMFWLISVLWRGRKE